MAHLKRRFSPRKIRLGSTSNALIDSGGSDATVFFVGRELCLFTTINASNIPAKQRENFVRMAVRRAAPFSDPDIDTAWFSDGSAAVWYWSRSKIAEIAASETGKRKRFVAESLYCGTPKAEGLELLQLASGVEARVWENYRLVASRWWAQAPAPEQWLAFMRGAGLQTSETSLSLDFVTSPLAETPWSKQSRNTAALQLSGLDQYLPKAAWLALATVLLIFGWEVGAIGRAMADRWRAESASTRLDAPLQKILNAREATDKASTDIDSLLSLHSPYSTTALMAEMTRLMPSPNWQLKNWSQPTEDTIEVGVSMPSGNPEELVAQWERSPMFENVSTDIGSNNELIIKATIAHPPATAPAPKEAP